MFNCFIDFLCFMVRYSQIEFFFCSVVILLILNKSLDVVVYSLVFYATVFT